MDCIGPVGCGSSLLLEAPDELSVAFAVVVDVSMLGGVEYLMADGRRRRPAFGASVDGDDESPFSLLLSFFALSSSLSEEKNRGM